MSYVFKTNLANKGNYGGSRSTSDIKYIVIHYTANDGDTDENNGNYFKNNLVDASAHYFVDDDSVTQSVPDNYVAWSVGGNKYYNCASTGGGKYYGICKNANSLNIELCDDVKNGVIYPSAKTIENAIELTKSLMKKYGILAANVIRHFDVTGKSCPAYWCGSSAKNKKWKTEFHNKLSGFGSSAPQPSTSGTMYRVRKTWADAKSQVGAYTVLSNAKKKADETGLNVYDASGNCVYSPSGSGSGGGTSFKVRVKISDLYIRKGPGTSYGKNGFCPVGVYTIVETKSANGYTWGRLKSGAGWIALEYTERL